MPQHPVAPRDLLFQVARDLIIKGWQPVWCLQRQSGGFSPAEGTTGYDAPYPTVLPQPAGAHRLGFRPPPQVVIIDVDHYDGKRGADTIDKAEAWLGDLPYTYKVTSRGYGDPSGRFLFRKPADLDFSDRAFAQFYPDAELGKPGLEILRTGHRFSWAPGDINHKNGLTVQCFDPYGEPCLLPDVNEVPWLPERWTAYLRNPPQLPGITGYSRPADGPQWWLYQADSSLGSDDELKSFTFNMMLSRVGLDEIYGQWVRVSRNDDTSWPWSREDFDRHARSQAQDKAAQAIAREDSERAVYEGVAGGEQKLNEIARQATDTFERESKLRELRDQRILETVQGQALFPVQPLEEDVPQGSAQSASDYLSALVRGTPEYDRQFRIGLARLQAEQDVTFILARKFSGFRDISRLEDPPLPSMLTIVGRSSNPQPLIAQGSITVISGHRSAGKTWVASKWAEQQITAGAHVAWVDFERQDRGLNAKFRYLGLQPAAIAGHVHYTDETPALPDLMEALDRFGPYLLVIDAWRGLQGRIAPGTGANDSDAVEQVYKSYLNPFAIAGGTVALLDHLPKTGTSTFGGERKESAADYVIRVEQIQPFTKRTPGFSMLTVTKDRWGETGQDTVAGYLWMPGDGSQSADTGITRYPKVPQFRNWAPEAELTLADTQGMSVKARKEETIIALVREQPLHYGTKELARTAAGANPDLFVSTDAAQGVISRLRTQGTIVREAGQTGKYDLPPSALEVHRPALDPRMLQHEEDTATPAAQT